MINLILKASLSLCILTYYKGNIVCNVRRVLDLNAVWLLVLRSMLTIQTI